MSKAKTEENKEQTSGESKGKPLVELSENELLLIEQQRKQNQVKANCKVEIEKILNKYGTSLVVDPNSPIGQPRVVIVLKN